MRRRMLGVVTVMGAAALAGCGASTGPGPRATPLEVRVVNQNRSDINLYLLRGGARSRLGTVVSNDTRVFKLRTLPTTAYVEVQFDVQRIGAEEVYRTPRVSLAPGQGVSLRVEDLLVTSSVSVIDAPPVPRKAMP